MDAPATCPASLYRDRSECFRTADLARFKLTLLTRMLQLAGGQQFRLASPAKEAGSAACFVLHSIE
jgi:hypothetical protein